MWKWDWEWLKKLLHGDRKNYIERNPIDDALEAQKPAPLPSDHPGKPREIADFKFVDSSHHHPEFDVKAYAKASKLLINKTSQGTKMIDSTHAKRQRLCKESGVIYGGYHFFETSKNWKDQLDHYMKAHGEFFIGPILDFETWDGGGQTMTELKKNIENAWEWMIEAEKRTGKKCILYAGYHVLVALQLPKKFERFIFWVPRYSSSIGKLPPPCNESNLMAWQFTESGEFAGFKGGNDVNIYYGKVNLLEL
jgi:GH25 family lysozyme M1 (1,4-beta-N-acetylmuramidase)